MRNMSTVIIGCGEVGKALYARIKPYLNIIHRVDTKKNMMEARMEKYDYMLVTIPVDINRDDKPETDAFIDVIREYKRKFNPKCIIVFSTVPIGTCEKLECAHAPIEGKHPNLRGSFKHWNFMLGYDGTDKLYDYVFFFKLIHAQVNVLPSRFTEFLKLQSTLMYAVNIEFARWANEMCKEINMTYNWVEKYNENYNELYKKLSGFEHIRRYILYPPEKQLEGHCVIPNAKMIEASHSNRFSKLVLEVDKWFKK